MSYFKNINIKLEILSGITVALALIPECIAFAIVCHVNPFVGIYTAAIICFITALIGGRPGLISGAAGSVAIVSVSLVITYGIEYLFLAAILMGIIEILIGVFKFGKFIRLVPRPVIYGFLNGLAIVIFLSQFEQLKTSAGTWISGMPLVIMIIFIILSMMIVYLMPKITKKVPSALIAILGVSIISTVLGVSTKTLGDIASITGGLPAFHIPQVPLTFEALIIVLPYAILMAAVGLIETLLTVDVVDEMTNTRGKANQESIAQGVANLICGFFQGMGGCAMVGQTMINLNSGARSRLSGISGGVVIFLIILFAAPLVEKIPIAALIGVMFMVAITTFEWASLHMLKNVPKIDRVVMIIVTALTVILNNLAIAVIIGVAISAIAFAWEAAKRVQIIYTFDKENNTEYYEVRGPLFFAGVTNFKDSFKYDTNANTVVINFLESRLVDQSALAAVNDVTKRFQENNVKVLLSHLSPDCIDLLKDVSEFVEVDILKDPYYTVPSDELD